LCCLLIGPVAGAADPGPRERLFAEAQQRYRSAQLGAAERAEAVEAARQVLRSLLDDEALAGHPLRPVWRNQLAELLLFDFLRTGQGLADAFVEAGVPTARQRWAFESAVPTAVSMVLQADAERKALEARLGRDADLRAGLEQTGGGERLFSETARQSADWHAAWAMHLAALLPDDSPYFQSLGAVPGQADRPAAERERLRRRALEHLDGFLNDTVGSRATRARARSLAGRIERRRGNLAAAANLLRPTAGEAPGRIDTLLAQVAWARTLADRGDVAAGRKTLADLAEAPAVRARWDRQLLVADARHLLLRQHTPDLDSAYGVYGEFLDGFTPGPQRAALRQRVFARWLEAMPTGGGYRAWVESQPAAVRLAAADVLWRRAVERRRAGGDTAARELLRQSLTAGRSLDDRSAVGDRVWAEGRYARAYATYLLNPDGAAGVLDAATLAVEVAEQTPDQAVAAEALTLAAGLIEPLHRRPDRSAGVAAAYARAMETLYGSEAFAESPAADRHRVYHAFATYQARGDYAAAAELYAQLPPSHPQYVEAQALRLACLTALLSGADAGQIERRIDELDAALRGVADAAAGAASDEPAARLAAASSRARAEIAARRGQVDEALTELERLEERFADRPALLRQGLQRRLLLLVEVGRLAEAQAAAGTLMGRFPDAAAGVIDGVLGRLERQIAGDRGGSAGDAADAAAAMAKLLAEWAEQRELDARQLLPYRLTVLRSLRLGGRSGEALAYLRDTGLDDQFPDHSRVLYEHARALLHRGDAASLRAAAPKLNRLINGLREPYPDLYWRAWIARLQINLRLGDDPAGVARRVRQLEVAHPDLGGEPFRKQLLQLRDEAADR
jgi:hypothetical protein